MELAVQPAPTSAADVGAAGFASHLYSCGEKVWVKGAIPGANFEVDFAGGIQGSTPSLTGDGHVSLAEPMPKTTTVGVRQVAGGLAGPTLRALPDAPPVSDQTAPAVTIVPPCTACEEEVLVTGIIDGATVTLTRASGATTYVCDASAMRLDFPLPLKQGEELIARQDLPRCEVKGKNSQPVAVTQKQPPGALQVRPPCAGATEVEVAGIESGAVVHIDIGGVSYLGTPAAPVYSFTVPPIQASAHTVSVTQERCGLKGPTATVSINAHEDVKTPVTIVSPLIACGRALRVINAHEGSLLQAFARDQSGREFPISKQLIAHSTWATIEVAPYLREGDEVTVRQWACSTTPTTSAALKVDPHAAIEPPRLPGNVYSGVPYVEVQAIAGSLIEVELRAGEVWVPVGQTFAVDDVSGWTIVYLSRVLVTGDVLRARQTLCDVRTEPSAQATVVHALPTTPQADYPVNVVDVPVRPTFRWHDTGSGDLAPESYEIEVHRANGPSLFNQTGITTPSWTPPTDLAAQTEHVWILRARNAGGLGGAVNSDFTTGKATVPPPPPPPHLDSYDLKNQTLTGGGFLANHAVTVRLVMMNDYVYNHYGASVADGRQYVGSTTADGQGKISVVINPQTALPPLILDDTDQGVLSGVASNEKMYFSATDSRPGPGATGVVWSNTLVVTAP